MVSGFCIPRSKVNEREKYYRYVLKGKSNNTQYLSLHTRVALGVTYIWVHVGTRVHTHTHTQHQVNSHQYFSPNYIHWTCYASPNTLVVQSTCVHVCLYAAFVFCRSLVALWYLWNVTHTTAVPVCLNWDPCFCVLLNEVSCVVVNLPTLHSVVYSSQNVHSEVSVRLHMCRWIVTPQLHSLSTYTCTACKH